LCLADHESAGTSSGAACLADPELLAEIYAARMLLSAKPQSLEDLRGSVMDSYGVSLGQGMTAP